MVSDHTQDSSYGRVHFYKLIHMWSLKTEWERFRCGIWCQGLLESCCVFPQQHRKGLFHLFIFYKSKENVLCNFCFQQIIDVLHFYITAIIMKEVFLIFKSILTIYWILQATLPCNLQKLVPAILVFLFLLPFLHLLIRYCRLPFASAWNLFT